MRSGNLENKMLGVKRPAEGGRTGKGLLGDCRNGQSNRRTAELSRSEKNSKFHLDSSSQTMWDLRNTRSGLWRRAEGVCARGEGPGASQNRWETLPVSATVAFPLLCSFLGLLSPGLGVFKSHGKVSRVRELWKHCREAGLGES